MMPVLAVGLRGGDGRGGAGIMSVEEGGGGGVVVGVEVGEVAVGRVLDEVEEVEVG